MKSYKPTTPSRRHMTTVSFTKAITSQKPHKALTSGLNRASGRNHHGRITTRHKGGGHKRSYRDIDFTFNKKDIPATVVSIEYDPNRSGFIGLVSYKDGEKRYMLLPKGIDVGSEILVSDSAPLKAGNRLSLKNISIGTYIYNIEIKPGAGAVLVRSAGNYAEVLAKDAGYVDVKLPSSEIRKIREEAWASIGEVSKDEHRLITIGKAGRNRWKGIRPTVRGTAMNPVDHPMGGGEARSRGRRKRIKSKWGKPVNPGQKTRTPKKYSNRLIVSRRKKGRR